MSQIAKEISQINQTRAKMLRDFNEGKLQAVDFYEYDLKYMAESRKRENLIVQIMTSAAKHKTIMKTADTVNLLDSSAINTGDAEVEMIKCPETDRLITRGECLDSQGAQCNGCSRRKETQDKLLGPK